MLDSRFALRTICRIVPGYRIASWYGITTTCITLLMLCSTVPASGEIPASAGNFAWDNVQRVVAIGDVHGAYDAFVGLLQGNGLIDDQLNWQGGATHMVNVGDLLDRGAQSCKVMDLLIKLQPQAQDVGGRVHVLLGNHELMNLTGDLRDVSAEEMSAFGSVEAHRKAISLSGPYGKWLLAQPIAIRINNTLFLHGGVSSHFGDSVAGANKRFRAQLKKAKRLGESLIRHEIIVPDSNLLNIEFDSADTGKPQLLQKVASDPLFGTTGPLWYRGNAACHPLLEQATLQRSLTKLGVDRVVIGHTPTLNREIETRLDGMVYVVDTGMLKKVYKGHPRALEITPAGVRALTPDGTGAVITTAQKENQLLNVLNKGSLAQNEAGQWSVNLEGDSKPVEIITKKLRRKSLTAYRFDRHLGLGFVPVTVARELEGKPVVLVHKPRRLTEARRSQYRPNNCDQGSDYDLVAVFDSLVGKLDRDGETLA